MFQRFGGSARSVVVLAQEEARVLNHDYVGPEHILLGLLRHADSLAAESLASFGVTLARAEQRVLEIIGEGQQAHQASGNLPFTAPAKKVLGMSEREMFQRGNSMIEPHHLLLAILRHGEESLAAQIMLKLANEPESKSA